MIEGDGTEVVIGGSTAGAPADGLQDTFLDAAVDDTMGATGGPPAGASDTVEAFKKARTDAEPAARG